MTVRVFVERGGGRVGRLDPRDRAACPGPPLRRGRGGGPLRFTGRSRRIAHSALLPPAAASYTVVFSLVEWDLRHPYTVDDVVIRCVSAVATPWLIARAATRDTAMTRVTASVPGLLMFIGSLGPLAAWCSSCTTPRCFTARAGLTAACRSPWPPRPS